MPESVLGISAYYHDSAAAIIIDGEVIAAAHEERFSRKKHDSGFPANAIRYVLDETGMQLGDLTGIAFYDKPYIKFERLLETYHAFAPRGLSSFLSAIPVWIKEKLFMKKMLRDELDKIDKSRPPLLFPEHHLSHAASAFYPSPFDEAAILTIDGVGEWATTTIGIGKDQDITVLRQLDFPHSLGLLYSAFTYYCGFRVNSGEYKLMGLAPYGNRESEQYSSFVDRIVNELVDIREDGSILMNMSYFSYPVGLRMCFDRKWKQLFGIERRKQESVLSQSYMNLAAAIQDVTEDIVIRLAKTARETTGLKHLVMAGGVALNCVANGKILREKIFDDIWIQPAAGDAGGAIGAAYAATHIWSRGPRPQRKGTDQMKGAYLGPQFYDADIERTALKYHSPFKKFREFDELCQVTVQKLTEGSVVGWFQGRMEYGPRALGNRSILGDPRNAEMQKKLNLKIKYREGFRPFAPSVLEEDISEFFDLSVASPYMLLVAPVKKERCNELPKNYEDMELYERLYFIRSDVPAITHVDFSARVQSVSRTVNDRYWTLINTFKKLTGFGVVVNTSFNVRGEPIVCTPNDAYTCFMRTEMDYLVMGNYLFEKASQPEWKENENWQSNYVLD